MRTAIALALLLVAGPVFAQKPGVTVFDSAGNEVNFATSGGGTGGTAAVQYPQGSVATPTDSLIMTGCVRMDVPTAGALQGQRIRCIVDSFGSLWVRQQFLTPTGGQLVDDTNDALRVSNVTVTTTQGKTQAVRTVTVAAADGAQTNLKLVTVGAGVKVRVSRVLVACSSTNITGVDVRLGYGLATLAPRALAGAAGVFLDLPKLSPGQRAEVVIPAAEEGASDEDLLLSMESPTGGSCSVTFAYEVI